MANRRSRGMPLRGARRFAIVYRPIAELKRTRINPRIHDDKQVGQIASSIETFDFVVPIIIDLEDCVIAGHGRLQAGERLGLTHVPTIRVEHLSEAQITAFMIADNRLTENSRWDDRLIAQQLKDLSEVVELDFNIEVTGFDMGEIDLRIEGLASDSEGAEDAADALPASRTGSPVTRPGDVWLLGRHLVGCGSALEDAALAALMQNSMAAMVFTDPPYNVAINGHVCGQGAIKHRDFAMASGEMNEAEFSAFLHQALSPLVRYTSDGSLHFVCMDWRHLFELLAAARPLYTELKNLCVWVKDNGGMGSLYRSQHELIAVFKNGHGSHRNNIQLGQFGRNRTNVWRYPGANSFSRQSDEGNLLALHPTVKPVQLVADAIMDCSARGDIVLDTFLGSGTTVIAAERTGRRCCGLEVDPLYVDTVVRRWQSFTGESARHAASGRTFNELEAEAKENHGER